MLMLSVTFRGRCHFAMSLFLASAPLAMLECHFSWQVQHAATLQFHFFVSGAPFGAGMALVVASAIFGGRCHILGEIWVDSRSATC